MKYAAAYAFGRAAVSDPNVFLMELLNTLETQQKGSTGQYSTNAVQKIQYLILLALKEFITCHSSSNATSMENEDWVKLIMPHLVTHSCDQEESVRMMVAECLGCLTNISPDMILP